MKTSSKLIVTGIGFGVSAYIHYLVGTILLDMGTKWVHLAGMLRNFPFAGLMISSCFLILGAMIKAEE